MRKIYPSALKFDKGYRCACGCWEEQSVSPVSTDPRVGRVLNSDVKPEEVVSEPPRSSFYEWAKVRSENWVRTLEALYGAPLCGRNRAVFRAGNYVYKVPLNVDGISDNEAENAVQSRHYADCWLEYDAQDFPILIMERVLPAPPTRRGPRWAWGIDCGQVGYSVVTGRLVAYDYGCS